MNKFLSCLLLTLTTIGFSPDVSRAAEPYVAPDLSKDPTIYWIGYTHLDTQWRWTYPQVINQFIPETVLANEALLNKYPHYVFNWTGANRYRLLKEYNPTVYGILSNLISRGRWFPAGSSWEENDVNLPSSESLIRQILFGHDYFKKEFGTESVDYMLPDCFGFPASLPSVLAHCGIKGFSTQKLEGWRSSVDIPFPIGNWQGPDGQSIVAVLRSGNYGANVNPASTNQGTADALRQEASIFGIAAAYLYYGRGDTGGAPEESDAALIDRLATMTNPVRIVSARADQLFLDITDAVRAKMKTYQGDLLLTEHSAGSISSQAYMKYWNHENENLAFAAEGAATAAHVLGALPYPRESLHKAWELVLGGQFHDLLPGTSLPKAFEYTWNDEIIALNTFAGVLQDSVGAIARGLNTSGEGTPLVVYNPLSVAREDVVEAELDLPPRQGTINVTDGSGHPVPSQLLSAMGPKTRFLFLAKAPAMGCAVFNVKAGSPSSTSELKVTERTLENARYRIGVSEDGDITNLFDKSLNRELLFKPIRLAFLTENPAMMGRFQFPAWNMDWADHRLPPRSRVQGPAKLSIVENGPVRAALKIDRSAEGSTFSQTIRLSAGSAGERVEIANAIDWQTKAAALKVEFPLTVTNSQATYNWDLGKIERGNYNSREYEVPTHRWLDLTDKSGDYGVSILTGAKFGSDKPADMLLRLTLLYSPGVVPPAPPNVLSFPEQQWQDWGHHEFVYGIYSHPKDWRSAGSDWAADRMEQPMYVFRTSAHPGTLGRSFSLLHVNSDQIAVRAMKLSEDGDQILLRLQELDGTNANAVAVSTTASTLSNAKELNGVEKLLHPIEAAGGALKLDFTPYQIRTVAFNLAPTARASAPISTPIDLPFNLCAFTLANSAADPGFDKEHRSYPTEMMRDTITASGINFKMGNRASGSNNCVICQGQTLNLPAGPHNRLFLLAASSDGDTTGDFKVDGKTTTLGIQNWGGYIGQWDNRVFKGNVAETEFIFTNDLDHIDAGFIKRDTLAWYSDHRHDRSGANDVYRYAYLFKYRLEISNDSKTLTLPDNPKIRVFAVTVSQNENDEVAAAHPLYDDFTGRKPIALRADH